MGSLGSFTGPNLYSKRDFRQASASTNNDAKLKLKSQSMDERNKDVEFLSKHSSNHANLLKLEEKLEEKRTRFLVRIQQAMVDHAVALKKRGVDIETFARNLEILAETLLERNKKIDEFFHQRRKFKSVPLDEDRDSELNEQDIES